MTGQRAIIILIGGIVAFYASMAIEALTQAYGATKQAHHAQAERIERAGR